MNPDTPTATPSKNALCPCGSGRKYKRCCGQTNAPAAGTRSTMNAGTEQVIQLYQQGRLPAAEQLALQLLRRQPNDAVLIEIAAVAALQMGRIRQAVERLQRQIALQPGNALAHSNLCMALHSLGRDEEAYAQGQQAITLDPQLADAWNNLGNIYKSGNQLQGALEHYEKALALDGRDPDILVNAGSVSQQLGDLETARQRYRQAIDIAPQFAAAWNNLGTVLQRLEEHDAAEQAFRQALALQPDNPEFLTNYGAWLQERNQAEQAREYFERAMRLAPGYVGAWVSMGTLHERLHDQDAAQRYYSKALELDPENTTAHCNIAYRMYDIGEQQQAVDHFVRALKSNPNSSKALAGLGKAMLRQDQLGKAEEYINRAMQLAPWDIHAHIAKASLLDASRQYRAAEAEWKYVIEQKPHMAEGYTELASLYAAEDRIDAARELFHRAEQNDAANVRLYHAWSTMEERIHNLEEAERLAGKALEISPTYPGLHVLQAKLARRRKDYAAALELLEKVDTNTISINPQKVNYYFELGAVLDKLKRYPEAFAAYKAANDAKNTTFGRFYDPEEDDIKFVTWKRLFSRENWPRLAVQAAPEDTSRPRPIFIVGFPRSGTSLLEQILGAHPEIAPAGELTFMNDIAISTGDNVDGLTLDFHSRLKQPDEVLPTDLLVTMRDYYLDRSQELGITDDRTRWITDKMPHNAILVGLIRLLFPKSPIIHISRHPLNSCLSAYFSNFKASHRYTSSLEATARHYRNIMDLLEHYRQIGVDFLEVHYEDLVTDQEAVTRRILEYIGAPWDEACLQHHKSDRVVRTASYEQVTQKVYTSSMYRYRNYYDAVQDAIPILQSTIEHFGYTTD